MLLKEVAHLRHENFIELAYKYNKFYYIVNFYTHPNKQAEYTQFFSQKRVSSCVLDAADHVHIHIVIMQCFRSGDTACFSQQNPQPAAHLHRTARLRFIILHNYPYFLMKDLKIQQRSHFITSRAANSVLDRMIRKAKGCLGPRPGKTSTPWRAKELTWVWISPLSLWKYRVPFLTQHQRSFQHWFTRTFK